MKFLKDTCPNCLKSTLTVRIMSVNRTWRNVWHCVECKVYYTPVSKMKLGDVMGYPC